MLYHNLSVFGTIKKIACKYNVVWHHMRSRVGIPIYTKVKSVHNPHSSCERYSLYIYYITIYHVPMYYIMYLCMNPVVGILNDHRNAVLNSPQTFIDSAVAIETIMDDMSFRFSRIIDLYIIISHIIIVLTNHHHHQQQQPR